MNTYLLLCHTVQEFLEWKSILNDLAHAGPFSLRVLPTWEFDCAFDYSLDFHPGVRVERCPLGFDPRSLGTHYRRLPTRRKLSVLREMTPSLLAALDGVDVVCSGGQIIFPRYLYRHRRPGQVFVSLLRSLHLPLRESRSVLLKRHLLRAASRCVGLDHLISPTAGIGYTDYYLTIGQLNHQYLCLNGINPSTIRIIGSPSLDPLLATGPASPTAGGSGRPLRVCFLSQAFDYHMFFAEQEEQNRCIREFLSAMKSDPQGGAQFEAHIKLHPRDRADRYNFLNPGAATLHTRHMSMAQVRDSFDVFVSWTSTLALEMMALDRPAVFVSGPALKQSYGNWFQAMGIQPLSNGREVYEQIKSLATGPGGGLAPSRDMKEQIGRVFSFEPGKTAAQRGAAALSEIMNAHGLVPPNGASRSRPLKCVSRMEARAA